MKQNETGRTSGTHGTEEKCLQDFDGANWRREDVINIDLNK
jgi:hypothetical protein